MKFGKSDTALRRHRSAERRVERDRAFLGLGRRERQGKQHGRESGAAISGGEGAGLSGLHLAPLFVSVRPGVAVWRRGRAHDARRQGILSARSAQPRRFFRLGADWLERYKPFIEDGKTVVVSPHKVWGPQTNDLVLQLRKRGISKIILAGMLANLCVESHLRELLEQGFEVAVVKDATAAPRHPVIGDGYQAAMINYGFLANAVLTTDEAVKAMAS